jgi:hypothetical protein
MWIGRNRKARVTYGFDEIALVPGRITINPNEVDITWRDGKLTEAGIRSLNGGFAKLRCGSVTREAKLSKGETYRWNGS